MDRARTRIAFRAAVFTTAAVAGFIAWVATRDRGESPAAGGMSGLHVVDARELDNIAVIAGHPVYWAGHMAGAGLEVIEGARGAIQVRYTRDGSATAGSRDSGTLTIGSYPLPDPAGSLAAFAERPGSVIYRGRGRAVVVSKRKPTSAYFLSPDHSVQVEVYDPVARRALSLALSGRVRPAR